MVDQNQNPNIEVQLSVDLTDLRQGFAEAQQIAQQGVQQLSQSFQQLDQANAFPSPGIPSEALSNTVYPFLGYSPPSSESSTPPPPPPSPTDDESSKPTSEELGRFIGGRSRGGSRLSGDPLDDISVNLASRQEKQKENFNSAPSETLDPNDPLSQLRSQFQNIQNYTARSRGLFGFMGQPQNTQVGLANLGMLQNQIYRSSAEESDPERVRQYQQLIDEIKNLTDELKDTNKNGGALNPAMGILRLLQGNAIARVGNTAIQDATSGNVLGSAGGIGGAGLGGVLGLLGGPAGFMLGAGAGQALGRGLGTAVQGLANLGENYSDVEKQATDLAARFGDFTGIDQLAGNQLTEYGYTTREALQQIEGLRGSGAVDTIGEATDLLPAVQELSRALGMNAQAITENTASLRRTEGGEVDRQRLMNYTADVVAGAIESGFEARKGEFQEVYSSLSSQSVYRTLDPIQGEEREGLLGLLSGFFGTGGALGSLLQANPQLGGQLAQGALDVGVASDRGSTRAAFLRLAGIDEGDIVGNYQDVDQRLSNLGQFGDFASQYIPQQFLGISEDEFLRRQRENPDYLRSVFQENPLIQEGFLRQAGFDNPQQQAILSALIGMQARGEDLSIDSLKGNEQLIEQIEEAEGTTAADLRELEAELTQELLNVSREMQGLFIEVKETVVNMAKEVQKLDFESITKKLEGIAQDVDKFFNGENGLISKGIDLINWIDKTLTDLKPKVEGAITVVKEAGQKTKEFYEDFRNSVLGDFLGISEEVSPAQSSGSKILLEGEKPYKEFWDAPFKNFFGPPTTGFEEERREATQRDRERVQEFFSFLNPFKGRESEPSQSSEESQPRSPKETQTESEETQPRSPQQKPSQEDVDELVGKQYYGYENKSAAISTAVVGGLGGALTGGLAGAAVGAKYGAAAGTVFAPGGGTALGATIGGITGFLGGAYLGVKGYESVTGDKEQWRERSQQTELEETQPRSIRLSSLSFEDYKELNPLADYNAYRFLKSDAYNEYTARSLLREKEDEYGTSPDYRQREELDALRKHLELLQSPQYNDTPGGVTVTPQTQVMRFAVGDVVEAESTVGRVNRANATDRKILESLTAQVSLAESQRQFLEKIFQLGQQDVDLGRSQITELKQGNDQLESVNKELNQLGKKVKAFHNSFESYWMSDLAETALDTFFPEQKQSFSTSGKVEGEMNFIDRLMSAFVGKESGGNSGVINRDHGNHYGLAQVSEANIPVWTKEALGRSLSPQEFLNDSDAQRKTIRHKLNQYFQQAKKLANGDIDLAIRMTASKWYSGRFENYNSTRSQGKYPTIKEYSEDILERYSSLQPPPPRQSQPSQDAEPQYKEVTPLPSLPSDLKPPSPPQQQSQLKQEFNVSVNLSIPDSVVESQDFAWIRRAAEEGVTAGIDPIAQDIFQQTYRTS